MLCLIILNSFESRSAATHISFKTKQLYYEAFKGSLSLKEEKDPESKQ